MVSRLYAESNRMNVGGLSFTYGLETDDTVGSSYVFNAHDASWITFARGLFGACQNMYRNRESAGCFDSANFLAKVKTWQATRPERVWVADAQRKYLRPYEDNGTVTYIPMLCGRKTHQRAQVKTYNAYYYASKYVSSFCTSQNIMVRGNTPTTWQGVAPQNKATLSMYINCYIVVASTSYNVVAKTKAARGQSYVMDFSSIGSMGETELYFCTAPMITELSGLAHLYFKQNNFAMGTNLQRLEIGSSVSGYTNPNLENLTIGNNKMLEYLDVRNCPNATGALDLSGCVSLSEIYLENTSFTGITFATGGLLSIAHLPSPTSLTLRELIYVTDLTLGSANALATLRVEDCDFANTAELTIGNTTTAHSTKDITLNLVESSPNLSRTRLIGIDWILQNENVLNRIYNMAGISDSSYDIAQSVLTGDVYVPTMRSGLYDKYMAVWQYLTITYSTMVAQYLATFVNDDGSAIIDRNGNAYTQWVDSGSSPYNPITMGYTISIYNSGNPSTSSYDASDHDEEYYFNTENGAIYLSDGTDWNFVVTSDVLIPSKASTAQYVYTFTGWDDLSAMSTARTITAQYSSTTRTYTVTWWKNPSTSLEIQTGVLYGAEVNYSGDIPQDTTQESTYTYKLFKGWDKSTGFITGDTNVYAVWDEASGFPSTSVEMSDMTPVQIYGIGQAGKQADYFEDLDYVDIKLGHDFDFSNVQSCEIGKDKMLTGIPRDTFVSGGYYFDGEHTYTTDIKLFDENSPAFTMVVDFQFSDVTSNSTLVSGDDGNTWVFRIYHNGTNVVLRWGDQSVNIGYGQYRDIVVVRHPQGSKRLFVYAAGNVASDRYGDSVVRTPLLSNTLPQTTKGLTFGGVEYPVGYRDYAKGHVHWCKIWYEDIGEENAYALASWPRETIRLEYWGAEKFYYYGTSTKSKLSFICNSQLGGLRGRGYYMNSSNTNVGGWNESKMRTFCNGRVFNALPTEWQAMIKAVEILTTHGNQSTAITQAEDKIYLPSYYEVGGSGTGYNDEHGATATRIPWLTSNPRRIKFRGRTRKYASDSEITIYTQAQEPAALLQTDITPGSIWINTSNNSIGYIFVEKDELDEYGFTASIAADPEYALGGWMIANSWWSRSPYVSNTTSFGNVGNGGGLYDYTASNTIGVVFGFSI